MYEIVPPMNHLKKRINSSVNFGVNSRVKPGVNSGVNSGVIFFSSEPELFKYAEKSSV